MLGAQAQASRPAPTYGLRKGVHKQNLQVTAYNQCQASNMIIRELQENDLNQLLLLYEHLHSEDSAGFNGHEKQAFIAKPITLPQSSLLYL